VLKRDTAGAFRFAALQSDVARELLGAEAASLEGVVLVVAALTAGQSVYRRSDAVVEVLRLLGRSGLGQAMGLVPRAVREAGYGVMARLRYGIFGRYEACPLPPVEVRVRFAGLPAGDEA
ncbi:MAG: DUF393 domain-containing protein, partial [Acidobacteria bacterium]|nr:DUF393 domain-containing protein [Acidobacteriota bacterium]